MATLYLANEKVQIDNTNGNITCGAITKTEFYGGFYAYTQAIPFNITVASKYHAFYQTAGQTLIAGLLSNFTFYAGRLVDANITSEANGTGGKLRIACSAAHGLTTGDLVMIGNANNLAHNAITLVTIDGTNPTTEFLCDNITYVAGAGASAATVTMPAYLLAGTGSTGVYAASLVIDGTASNLNKVWKWELNIDTTPCDNTITERNTTNTLASMSASGLLNITAGNRVWLSGMNSTDTTDYTVRNMNINLHKL